MKMDCLISVVIAAYNESLYLEEALLSVLSQQNVDLEVIFVDDNSNDSTLAIAQGIARTDSRLKVFRNIRKGKCSAFNYGVSLANGDYICIFAGDDIMPQDSLFVRLNSIYELGLEQPVVGLSKLITMCEDIRFDGTLIPKSSGVGALSGVSPLMNQKSLKIIFPVPEFLPNEDTWMELAISHLNQLSVVHSDVICCKWRMHVGNSINMKENYDIYNIKFSERMRALPLFLDKFKQVMTCAEIAAVEEKIHCERMRFRGSILGVLFSKVSLVNKLRALSITNKYFYIIRKSFYSILSGF
jgi:glycosyltransferase involved in cell wall biosynthesis